MIKPKKYINVLLGYDFIRFCIVGTGGFVINSGLLFLLYKKLNFPIFPAQAISSEIALLSNFLLHNSWTYKKNRTHKTIKELLVQFHVTSWIAIVGGSLLVSLLVSYFDINYMIALGISSIIALFWNFAWTKFLIWKHREDELTAEMQLDN